MRVNHVVNRRHQFRLALCGHEAVEAGAVCVLLMVQGDLAGITLTHLAIAAKTGLLAVSSVLGVTFSRYARHMVNRWTSSALLGVSAFVSDAVVHGSHYPGAYTEAALTAAGAFALSLAISYTPIGQYTDRLAEAFLDGHTHVPVAATAARRP